MNNAKRLQVYPSGFMGASVVLPFPAKKSHADEIVEKLNYDTDMFSAAEGKFPFNLMAEKLCRNYFTGDSSSFGWGFKEKFLCVSINAFGTYATRTWLSEQTQSSGFTSTHQAFLLDTLNYLNGAKRIYPIETWDMFFDRGISIDCDKSYNEIVKLYTPYVRIIDLIKAWCQHQDGFSDLVKSIHILFGG